MVDEPDADPDGLGLGWALAAALVVFAACFLAVLPAAAAAGWVGAVLGSLGTALFG